MVIRGHEVINVLYETYSTTTQFVLFQMATEGYEFTPDKKVLTVFTAPHYCDHTNDGAVVYVDGELQCQIWVSYEQILFA